MASVKSDSNNTADKPTKSPEVSGHMDFRKGRYVWVEHNDPSHHHPMLVATTPSEDDEVDYAARFICD